MIRVIRVRFFERGKWYSFATEEQFNTLELAKEHFEKLYSTNEILLLDYEEC